MQVKNAVGSNTPGAASSAADFFGGLGAFWEDFSMNFGDFVDAGETL